MKGMRLGREKTGSSAGHKPKKSDKLMRGQKKPGPSVQAAVDLDELAEAAPFFVDARVEFAKEAQSPEEGLERMGQPSSLPRLLGAATTLYLGDCNEAMQHTLLDAPEDSLFWAVVGTLPPRRAGWQSSEERAEQFAIAKGRRVAAVITGLEYWFKRPPYGETEPVAPAEEQQAAMKQACQVAVDWGVPLVVIIKPEAREEEACALAVKDAVACLEATVPSTWKILFSAWSGPPLVALKLLKKFPQSVIGFNGALSFRAASHLRELAFDLALDRLLLESDAPNNAPSEPVFPHSPWTVLLLADIVSSVKKTTSDVVLKATIENAGRFYGRSVVQRTSATEPTISLVSDEPFGEGGEDEKEEDEEDLKKFL